MKDRCKTCGGPTGCGATRGCCSSCYNSWWYSVDAGLTSWDKLERLGKTQSAKSRGGRPRANVRGGRHLRGGDSQRK